MTIMQMFTQSGALAALGMGVVFGFLIILTIVINMAGQIIHAAGLDKDAQAAPPAGLPAKTTLGSIDNAVVAAITAAVKTRRNE